MGFDHIPKAHRKEMIEARIAQKEAEKKQLDIEIAICRDALGKLNA